MLTPMLVLICWTLVMLVWLGATRLPAMRRARINPARMKDQSELDVLPQKVRNVGANYNHLHEQPVIFYALVVYSHLAGMADPINIALAWAYVVSRVIHSLIQATSNYVPWRFAVFMLGSLCLMLIAIRNGYALLF